MSKLGLEMQIFVAFFILFLIISAIATHMLIRIKKTEYPDLWEKDEEKAARWGGTGKYVLRETALRPRPEWLKENKKARFWLLIYWLSSLTALFVLCLPIILALVFGVYLFH
jgi:hypothetical protein